MSDPLDVSTIAKVSPVVHITYGAICTHLDGHMSVMTIDQMRRFRPDITDMELLAEIKQRIRPIEAIRVEEI